MQALLFSDFAPDLDSITPGACQDMSGVYPIQSGFYRTMPGLQMVGQGLPTQVLGGYAGLLIDQPVSVAATQRDLWIYRNGFYVNSALALTDDSESRRFATYGNLIIVVDGVNRSLLLFERIPFAGLSAASGMAGQLRHGAAVHRRDDRLRDDSRASEFAGAVVQPESDRAVYSKCSRAGLSVRPRADRRRHYGCSPASFSVGGVSPECVPVRDIRRRRYRMGLRFPWHHFRRHRSSGE